MTQFEKVNSTHGAPMGRASYGDVHSVEDAQLRLFKVRLDYQGYDDGGAYWGAVSSDTPFLFCAEGQDYRAFQRAWGPAQAAAELGIPADKLKKNNKAWQEFKKLHAASEESEEPLRPESLALLSRLKDLGFSIRHGPNPNFRATSPGVERRKAIQQFLINEGGFSTAKEVAKACGYVRIGARERSNGCITVLKKMVAANLVTEKKKQPPYPNTLVYGVTDKNNILE